eukprot:CAMPEP_0115551356 /NCGR_PEP_ID=MMETSP0271-20121206/95690_1 /TAXON_ID=71861 /ORGANISM="Scrippsiella trochoidea, Strain CCMP3099" /LENGTH=129 /DNA_ID=CAMNT_0002984957 /DNA_START=557 /DNA_END=946 /DNA_ORIENTATION=+
MSSIMMDTPLAEYAPCFAPCVDRLPARFVGGSRRSQQRTSRSQGIFAQASQRTARRAMGTRLQPRVQAEPVVLSFDASRLRKEIQNCLRVPSAIRAAHSRESKTSACTRVCASTSSVYFKADCYRLRRY